MVLVTRNNESFLILPYSGTSTNLYAYNTKNSSQVNLDIWDENLFNRFENPDMDVVEVQAIKYFIFLMILKIIFIYILFIGGLFTYFIQMIWRNT